MEPFRENDRFAARGAVGTAARPKVSGARGIARKRPSHVRIVSAGAYLPEQRVSSADIEDRIEEASPGFRIRRGLVKTHTGIDFRHYSKADEQASDLATRAAAQALARANATASDVDLLIFGSASQDLIEPATAHIVAAKLGLRCPVFDVKNACNSWLNGMQVATSLLASGAYRTALVVTGECPSRAVRFQVEGWKDLFAGAAGYTMGDAGAAVFLAYDPESEGIFFQDFRASSEHWSIATLPGGGTMHPRGDEFSYFQGDGTRLRDAFVSLGPDFIRDALAATGTRYEDFRRIFCHQVTGPFLEIFLRSTEIPREKIVLTVPELGNIASATMPTQLALAMERGWVGPGDDVMFAGLGGGLSVGVMLARL